MTSNTKTALIVGATSGIAMACAELLAQEGYKLFLAARNGERLTQFKESLIAKYQIEINASTVDASNNQQQLELLEKATEALGHIDIALIAYGTLPTSPVKEHNLQYTMDHFNLNGTCTIALLQMLTPIFEKQNTGTIAIISSVAGDRGRKSNYLYGSAKAAVTAYASGLRGYLSDKGVNVLTIKPGFVDTAMTSHIESKGVLWASPDKVAQEILKAIKKKKSVIYTPKFWGLIMFIIKHIPERIFKKLNF